MIERVIQFLVYFHAVLGGVALVAGGIALIVPKGMLWHRRSGIVFFYTMLSSAILAMVIAATPTRVNLFLFSVGVFSTYFLISGYRSLSFRKPKHNLRLDKGLAYLIILTGLAMISYPVILTGKPNTVLLVFGVVALVFGLRDLRLYKNQKRLLNKWLRLHLGKMTGGYIAATTAFFVVNEILPGIWNWFVPGIVGSLLIIYWMRLGLKKLPYTS